MSTINIQHSDKWSVTISNIPGFVPTDDNFTNMGIYDNFIKSLTFPEHSLDLIKSDFRNFHINHPISKANENLGTLDITFKLSEGMKNWYYIYNWIKNLREGNNINQEEYFRLNFIKEININFLDNQKRPKYIYSVQNAFIKNLSSLSLTNGVDEELSFTITVEYEDFGIAPGECYGDPS